MNRAGSPRKTLQEIQEKAAQVKRRRLEGVTTHIVVGTATCGLSAGAGAVVEALGQEIHARGLQGVAVTGTGCVGICDLEPIVEVRRDGEPPVTYYNVNADQAREIIEYHLQNTEPMHEPQQRIDEKQLRITLRNCGIIDPESIEDYIERRGYEALANVLESVTPHNVVETISASGLRGRGGAGYPTGLKWKLTADEPDFPRYVICNADEGDPGAFMDRAAIEGDPHSILEGMAIGGYAIGSNAGYIYIRAEYPLALKRFQHAIKQAESYGLLGENILGSGFDFKIGIKLGAGAYVCGEETALIHSMEGRRGMPRPRPPYPSVSGLWEKPTLINNVETWANVPPIILNGPEWFAGIGTEGSKGTKVFALAGNIKNAGLVEVPMGTTLRQIIFDMSGGMENDAKFKALQIGGPAGGCIPEQYLDLPVDYESLKEIGSMIGSGGLVVMDEHTCMVDIAKFYVAFSQDESCGKCTPCREGTKRLHEILTRITSGHGEPDDIWKLERLSHTLQRASLCGLGQSAPNTIVSTLRFFRDEYEAHINEKRCPAGVCRVVSEERGVS
jgi:NADH:ubiquinone oxidoreductase subunit F (NADH-binding)/(2Fe-2S) ferredoxin